MDALGATVLIAGAVLADQKNTSWGLVRNLNQGRNLPIEQNRRLAPTP